MLPHVVNAATCERKSMFRRARTSQFFAVIWWSSKFPMSRDGDNIASKMILPHLITRFLPMKFNLTWRTPR